MQEIKTWQDRLREKFPETADRNLFTVGHLERAMEAEIADLRAALAAPQAADTDKVREAIEILQGALADCACHPRKAQRKNIEAKALKAVAKLASSMAAQAPVREVPEGDGLTGKWCYSTDGEEFQGQCDTEQEAHNEACEYVGSGQAYWIGRIKHPADCIGSNHSIGDDIITRADEAAYEECGGDDRAFEFSNEQCEQLGAMVREFIRREGSVNRWAVIDSKQYEAPAAPVQQEGDRG